MASNSHNIGIFSDGSVDVPVLKRKFVVPSTGKHARLKHDYQTAYANEEHAYKPRSFDMPTEVPETVHLNPYEMNDFVPVTREIQEFILATMRIADPYMSRMEAINRLHELTRTSVCFTDDGNSWDMGRTDYLFPSNLDADKPMGWKMLGFGGNIVRVIYGREIEAIDYLAPLPDPEALYRDKPWLFQWATQCYKEETGRYEVIDGKFRKQYKVARFPHMKPVGLLVPLFGAGGKNRIAEGWRMETISNGTIYSPYVG